jgi:hypothetical protein
VSTGESSYLFHSVTAAPLEVYWAPDGSIGYVGDANPATVFTVATPGGNLFGSTISAAQMAKIIKNSTVIDAT